MRNTITAIDNDLRNYYGKAHPVNTSDVLQPIALRPSNDPEAAFSVARLIAIAGDADTGEIVMTVRTPSGKTLTLSTEDWDVFGYRGADYHAKCVDIYNRRAALKTQALKAGMLKSEADEIFSRYPAKDVDAMPELEAEVKSWIDLHGVRSERKASSNRTRKAVASLDDMPVKTANTPSARAIADALADVE